MLYLVTNIYNFILVPKIYLPWADSQVITMSTYAKTHMSKYPSKPNNSILKNCLFKFIIQLKINGNHRATQEMVEEQNLFRARSVLLRTNLTDWSPWNRCDRRCIKSRTRYCLDPVVCIKKVSNSLHLICLMDTSIWILIKNHLNFYYSNMLRGRLIRLDNRSV